MNTPMTPEQRAAQIAAVQAKNAEAQAAVRVAAVEVCLAFRRLMIEDAEKAMEHAEALGEQLTMLGSTYRLLKQEARKFDGMGGA